MSEIQRIYSPAEAAAVSGVGVKTVHNAIDKRIVDAVIGLDASRLGPRRRGLTDEHLLRLKLWYGIGSTLAAERRERLFEAIKATPQADMVRADELLIIDVAEARRQLRVRIDDLKEAEDVIVRVPGVMSGEPVFRGTRIPARMIATMAAEGADEADILEGYPTLTPRLIELAQIWSAAHPARGRPKTLSEQGMKAKSELRIPLNGRISGQSTRRT